MDMHQNGSASGFSIQLALDSGSACYRFGAMGAVPARFEANFQAIRAQPVQYIYRVCSRDVPIISYGADTRLIRLVYSSDRLG